MWTMILYLKAKVFKEVNGMLDFYYGGYIKIFRAHK